MGARPWARPDAKLRPAPFGHIGPGAGGAGLDVAGVAVRRRPVPRATSRSRSLERSGWSFGVDGETRGLEPRPRLTPWRARSQPPGRAASATVTPPRRRTRSSGRRLTRTRRNHRHRCLLGRAGRQALRARGPGRRLGVGRPVAALYPPGAVTPVRSSCRPSSTSSGATAAVRPDLRRVRPQLRQADATEPHLPTLPVSKVSSQISPSVTLRVKYASWPSRDTCAGPMTSR